MNIVWTWTMGQMIAYLVISWLIADQVIRIWDYLRASGRGRIMSGFIALICCYALLACAGAYPY